MAALPNATIWFLSFFDGPFSMSSLQAQSRVRLVFATRELVRRGGIMMMRTVKGQLKGSRDYVQGPDVYNAVCQAALDVYGVTDLRQPTLTLRRPIRHDFLVRFHEPHETPDALGANGAFSCLSAVGQCAASIIDGETSIQDRSLYPEEQIVERCHLDRANGTVSLVERTPFSDVEVFVSMNKFLLHAVLPDAKGKWWFARFQEERYARHTDYAIIELRFGLCTGGRLAKSHIDVDGTRRGELLFYLIQ
jgi:hypothetical protein